MRTTSFGSQVTTEEHQLTKTVADGQKSEEEQHSSSTYNLASPPQTQPSAFKPVEFKVETLPAQSQPARLAAVPPVTAPTQQLTTQQSAWSSQQDTLISSTPQQLQPSFEPSPKEPQQPGRHVPAHVSAVPRSPVPRSPVHRSPAPRHSTPRYSSPSPQRVGMVRYPSEPSLGSYTTYSDESSYSRNVSQSPQRFNPVQFNIQMNGTADDVPSLKRPSQFGSGPIRRGESC